MWVSGLLLMAGMAPTVAPADEPDPTPELLEFLGSFETSAGEPIDPTLLELPSPDEPQATTEQGAEHD